MAIAFVANHSPNTPPDPISGSNTTTSSYGQMQANNTANTLVMVASGWASSGFAVNSITDAQRSWTQRLQSPLTSAYSGQFRAEIWTAPADSLTQDGVTLNMVSGSYVEWAIIEFSGVGASPTFQTGTDSGTDAGPCAITGVAASADADSVAIGCLSIIEDSNANIGTPTGYTQSFVEQDALTNIGLQAVYKINSSAATEACSWTHDDTSGADSGYTGALILMGDGDGDGSGGASVSDVNYHGTNRGIMRGTGRGIG